ncbi:MAG: hypothetical protein ABSC41_04800 [Acidimicrobiales bacterium]
MVQLLNSAGYYTEPTAQNVAVSLLAAQVDTTNHDPAYYLTENLSGVYTDPDPRTYPLSSYSYLILPTKIQGQFNAAEGTTLAAFSYYAMCQGQQQSAALGYSPMPINLVEASFDQITKIPGAVTQNINIQGCNNPTFTPTGANLLAETAPYPPACDKQGPTQCVNGTGGAASTVTQVSGNPHSAAIATGPGAPGSPGSSAPGTSSGSGGSGPGGTGGTGPGGKSGSKSKGGGSAAALAAVETCVAKHPHDVAACANAAATASAGTDPTPDTQTLAVTKGWSVEQTLILLIALVLIALILVPGGLLSRRLDRRKR